jgi:hypothetical protein
LLRGVRHRRALRDPLAGNDERIVARMSEAKSGMNVMSPPDFVEPSLRFAPTRWLIRATPQTHCGSSQAAQNNKRKFMSTRNLSVC